MIRGICRENKDGCVVANSKGIMRAYIHGQVYAQARAASVSRHVTTSLSRSIDPSEGDPFEFQSGWILQSFGCRTAAVLARPNSKHTIISLLTTADGHKVLESPSETSSDYKQNALALCVCACHAAPLAFRAEICVVASRDQLGLRPFLVFANLYL